MSTYTKRSTARRSDDTMDDDAEDKDDTKRKSRNLSEKKRRDQFNLLVNELSSMVSTGARKMDKSTVLRSTISFLKNHNEIAIRSRAHEIQEDWKPAFLSNEEFTHLILEALDGFIVVFSAAGHVHYVSESVTALLGHLPSELLNTSLYELVWDEEQAALYQALVGNGAGNGGTGPDGQLSFQAHLRRGGGGTHQPDGNDTVQQTVIAGFSAPTPITVLSPLLPTANDNNTLVLANASSSDPPTATHLQAQLQRKHAELQAIIDQQQAELRRVSEQLLMARLGFITTPSTTGANLQQQSQQQQQQNQPQPQIIQQEQHHPGHEHVHGPPLQHSMMNYPQHQVSNSYICSRDVSSTTSHAHGHQVSGMGNGGGPISVAIPVVSVAAHAHTPHEHLLASPHRRQSDETSTMALSQQQAQMLFATPALNNPEHK